VDGRERARMTDTETRCPQCSAVLAFPPGAREPRQFMDVMERHFIESCSAIGAPQAAEPHPDRHKPRH